MPKQKLANHENPASYLRGPLIKITTDVFATPKRLGEPEKRSAILQLCYSYSSAGLKKKEQFV